MEAINFRVYDPERDRDDAAECWEARGQFPLAAQLIPPSTAFVTADENDKLLAMAIFYAAADAPVAVLSWLVSRPELSPRLAHRAVSCAIEGGLYCLDKAGVQMILSRLSNRSVLPILSRNGFTPTREVKTEMARIRTFGILTGDEDNEAI